MTCKFKLFTTSFPYLRYHVNPVDMHHACVYCGLPFMHLFTIFFKEKSFSLEKNHLSLKKNHFFFKEKMIIALLASHSLPTAMNFPARFNVSSELFSRSAIPCFKLITDSSVELPNGEFAVNEIRLSENVSL